MLRQQLKQLCRAIISPLIAAAAIGCAFLIETKQLDYTYPLELVLKSIANDSAILTISTR